MHDFHWEFAKERQRELERLSRSRRAWRTDELPPAFDATVRGRREIVMRREEPADHVAICRLAELNDCPIPPRPLLVAVADGRLLAARSLMTGEALSDPFQVSLDLDALLDVRAGQLRPRPRRSLTRLLRRAAT